MHRAQSQCSTDIQMLHVHSDGRLLRVTAVSFLERVQHQIREAKLAREEGQPLLYLQVELIALAVHSCFAACFPCIAIAHDCTAKRPLTEQWLPIVHFPSKRDLGPGLWLAQYVTLQTPLHLALSHIALGMPSS